LAPFASGSEHSRFYPGDNRKTGIEPFYTKVACPELVERAKNAKAEEAFAADDADKDGWILASVIISG
jgi:hypothetical protein